MNMKNFKHPVTKLVHAFPLDGSQDAFIDPHLIPIADDEADDLRKPGPLTGDELEVRRAMAYREESDPIYFKWQRGEATQADWLASIQAIRDRYPKPE